jgi:TetR/AcrR family transcriptional regulator, transcriptional repressor of bet genes
MPRHKKKSAPKPQIPRARHAHSRQRQRLIDACISALHIYGPSRTTVEKVVAIAKMSPGIVRFYFASKAAMLVASLQFLANEFEEQLLVPVSRLKTKPVAALELMVDLYLDPEIASPRKVSVWYAFWGEASSRQEYYDICGQMDEGFAALVRELIERLIVETAQPQLDAGGVALGLMGALEMLWQDFAFRSEADIDRGAAKGRCMAYLRSIFPGQFGAPTNPTVTIANHAYGLKRIAGWAYDNARLHAMERERVFQDSWQLVGHRGQIPGVGDFLAPDLGIQRPLVLRDEKGDIRALLNNCIKAPHILATASLGRISLIECAVHGLQFGLDGKRRGGRDVADLTSLELRLIGDLIFVRSLQEQGAAASEDPWRDFGFASSLRPSRPTRELRLSADWKLVVEQYLDSTGTSRGSGQSRSARCYQQLLSTERDIYWPLKFIAPNHFIEERADGVTILQVLPSAPGLCRIRVHDFTRCDADRVGAIARYLASRVHPLTRGTAVSIAESTQNGVAVLGYEASQQAAPPVNAFRQYLLKRVPVMAAERPPAD